MSGKLLRGLVLAGIALVLTIGCEQPTVDRPATFPVTGTVTLDGNPVEGAAVVFVPGEAGNGAAGTTDASGKYSLTTFDGGDGAVPGEYSVKIAKYEGGGAEAKETGEDDEGMMSDDYDGGEGGDEGDGADDGPKSLLPEKYSNESTSELKASVTQGENSIDFALEN